MVGKVNLCLQIVGIYAMQRFGFGWGSGVSMDSKSEQPKLCVFISYFRSMHVEAYNVNDRHFWYRQETTNAIWYFICFCFLDKIQEIQCRQFQWSFSF